MSDAIGSKGSCICGAVSFTAGQMSKSVGACHCSTCRKWGGGPLLAVDCATDVDIAGSEHVGTYQSSDWAERGFCKQCGSHLFYKLKANGQYIMPVGLFDNGDAFIFDHQVFIEEKPDYYCFSNQTKDMTGEELFAQFSSEN